MSQFNSRSIRDTVVYTQDTKPDDQREGIQWVDTSVDPPVLRQYDPNFNGGDFRRVVSVYTGTSTPDPAEVNLWVDENESPPSTKVYNSGTGEWESAAPGVTTLNADNIGSMNYESVAYGTLSLTGGGTLIGGRVAEMESGDYSTNLTISIDGNSRNFTVNTHQTDNTDGWYAYVASLPRIEFSDTLEISRSGNEWAYINAWWTA